MGRFGRMAGGGTAVGEGGGRYGGRFDGKGTATTRAVKVILHDEADAEFQSAVATYQGESHELAVRFYRGFFATLNRIGSHPKAWPRLRGSVRKCLVQGFPYKLLYLIEPDRIFVVALMHAKRQPGYWERRL